MTPEEVPEEALPIPENAIVWSPITKQWYDEKGHHIYS